MSRNDHFTTYFYKIDFQKLNADNSKVLYKKTLREFFVLFYCVCF